jgi:GntR family transcriptional regulator/MocR family aminotransferase
MDIELNKKDSQLSLVSQVYQSIKYKIHIGTLKSNQKLPSTRQLSSDIKVSRNVIIEAYEQLFAEGYLKTIKGSGTYVNDGLILENYKTSNKIQKENIKGLKFELNENVIDFRTGVPNLSMFPKDIWGKLYKNICNYISPIQLDYYEPRGCYELRYELTLYLNRVRGILCQPSQIFITTGAAQSFSMIGQMFHLKSTDIIVEDPISNGAIECIDNTKFNIYPIPVDKNGLQTNLLPNNLKSTLIFTTPSHQFPTGSILPIKRRVELIEYSRKTSSYIIEDDYDSEFRFEGQPIRSMQSLDSDRVIYVGTLSKILCPALRLAYIVVPHKLVNEMCYVKNIYDIHSPVLEQLTLSKFINEGFLDKHIKKMKNFYNVKKNFVKNELYKNFNNDIVITGDSTGIHLVVEFKNINFNTNILNKLANSGLRIKTIEEYAIIKGQHNNKILIGYGNLSDKEIIDGIKILKKITIQ